jgi:hypothetical protein
MNKAILFLIFNRPDYTIKVFESIRLYKPKKLYIAADGPRINNQKDIILCKETRNIVKLVDWECEVNILFRDENLGCTRAVIGAIKWFFDKEEDGIILEDDVVPNLDFFYYCEFCLNKYSKDERVMMITGTNYLSNEKFDSTYFYSQHYIMWGWATWKRAWEKYDVDMEKWNDPKIKSDIKYMFNGNFIWKYLVNIFDLIKDFKHDIWDYQWVFACIINNGYCITPKVNLVSNIGIEGLHSYDVTDSHFLDKYLLGDSKNYKSPSSFLINSSYDKNLHLLKSKKANRKYTVIKILKFIKLYKILKKLKNKINKN